MKNPSSSITSFFKVMIGDNFSEILFLPPKFARTISALVDQEIQLEDSNGLQWGVTLSNVDGSFAFQEGWHTFSVDHDLRVGDFLVFNYIVGSHFVVQIYGKHGCQKVMFSEENSCGKKRTRTSRDFIAEDEPCHTIDKVSKNKQGSSASAVSGSEIEMTRGKSLVNDVEKEPIAAENTFNFDNRNGRVVSREEYVEEPYYIIDRDPMIKQGEDRGVLYDLSNFEMPVGNFDADDTNKVIIVDKISPHHATTSPRSQPEAVLVDKDPVAEAVGRCAAPSDASHIEMIEKSNCSEARDKILFMSGKTSGNVNTSEHLPSTSAGKPTVKIGNDGEDRLNIVEKKCLNAEQSRKTLSSNDRVLLSQKEGTTLMERSQSVPPKVSGILEYCSFPVPMAIQNCQSAERMNAIKQEQVEMMHGKVPEIINGCSQSINLAANDEVYKAVKTEPIDSFDLTSSEAVNISCLVESDCQSFLELPTCLPSISFKGRTRIMERKVVYLQDPVKRLWPVLYHQKYGLKILTSGWEAFSKGNNIQPGDQCVFGVGNELECIYRVDIVRNNEHCK